MYIFANKDIKNLFFALGGIWFIFLLLAQGFLWFFFQRISFGLLFIFLAAGGAIWTVCFFYLKKQHTIMEQAVSQIRAYLDGDRHARIACEEEGELYRLFHSVNSLAAVLNAHADNELREKEFLKNTISDISHQLKTPLAALNIYNGLLQDDDVEPSLVKEFADLSEQELDRIETLVQNLLKITKLDAGSVIIEKKEENVAEIMRDIELHFAYRAKQEQKKMAVGSHPQYNQKRSGPHRKRRYHFSPVETFSLRYTDYCKRQWQRYTSGRPAPHFQAVLPQPFFQRPTGHRAWTAPCKSNY